MRHETLVATALVLGALATPACRRPVLQKVPPEAYHGPTYSPPAPSSPTQVRTSARPSAGCVHGWTRPAQGTPRYEQPLGVLRATQPGLAGAFDVVDLRYFTDAHGVPRWYGQVVDTKDRSFALRFLVERGRVVAIANYLTENFVSPDWSGFQGNGGSSAYPNVPGHWPGRPYDYAKSNGLPVEVIGCLATSP